MLNKIFSNILFFFLLFPYFSIFKVPFDIQPWAFVIAIVFIFLTFLNSKNKIELPKEIIYVGIVVLYTLLIYIIQFFINDFEQLKALHSLFGYFSLLVFMFVGYKTWEYLDYRIFFGAIGVWLVSLFTQMFFGSIILSGVVSRFSTGGYRGFTSLAPEPAYYAIFCIFLLILNEFFFFQQKYKRIIYYLILFLLIFQILFTYSGVGIGLLLFFTFSKMLHLLLIKDSKEKKFILIAIIIPLLAVFMFTQNNFLKKTRGGDVLKNVINSPLDLYKNDLSVSLRLGNPIFGLYGGLVEKKGFGFGFSNISNKSIPGWLILVIGEERNFGGRIQGGLPSLVYEIGIMGLILSFVILFVFIKSIFINKRIKLILLISFMLILLPVMFFGSLAFPLFGYFLGIHLFYLYNHD